MKILAVCAGNICRSPAAEAAIREAAEELGLEIHVDSAGTGSWHAGERPDSRTLAEAARRGIEIPGRARQVVAADFARFDRLLVMDRLNERDLAALGAPADRYVSRVFASACTQRAATYDSFSTRQATPYSSRILASMMSNCSAPTTPRIG